MKSKIIDNCNMFKAICANDLVVDEYGAVYLITDIHFAENQFDGIVLHKGKSCFNIGHKTFHHNMNKVSKFKGELIIFN